MSSSSSTISVSLANADDFKPFYPFMEMMCRENAKPGHGKMIFPELSFNITGLDAHKMYEVLLSLERFDNLKYTYDKGQWTSKESDAEKHEYKQLSKGTKSGATWMEKPLTFPEARITRVQGNNRKDTFYTASLHKYVPVLHIREVTEEDELRFEVEEAQFIPTTTYYNTDLKIWKKEKNPYSTCRNGGPGNPIKKRKANEKAEEAPKAKRTPLKEHTVQPTNSGIPTFPTPQPSTSTLPSSYSNPCYNPQLTYPAAPGFGHCFPSTSAFNNYMGYSNHQHSHYQFNSHSNYQYPMTNIPPPPPYSNFPTASPAAFYPMPTWSSEPFYPPVHNENYPPFPVQPTHFNHYYS